MIIIYAFCILSFVVSTLLGILRFIKGPHQSDRVVVFDLFGSLWMSASVICALYFDQPIYLDVALLIALVSFVGSLGAAVYFERSGEK
ncbi:MAG: monovalent cation/H+ antiporter complex subunit F [Proteobacteria bacterium]|jgi:multicomponent Na+:H+ antiporter subunit F|nr:monovalent cation/H+ antiporter complex subunit F [Pseudomonadota bacterium]